MLTALARLRQGSSPLARGLLGGRSPSPATPGIIPARAGFTERVRDRVADRADHPRSRGVYPGPPGLLPRQ